MARKNIVLSDSSSTDLFLRTVGDAVLEQKAEQISAVGKHIEKLAGLMAGIMYQSGGVGLAATQVGVLKRMFIYEDGNKTRSVINPSISLHGDKLVKLEGCLSVPGIMFEVERYENAHMTGLGLRGEEIEIEAEGILAQIFQHELDHLDGILLTSRLADEAVKTKVALLN